MKFEYDIASVMFRVTFGISDVLSYNYFNDRC